MINPWPHAPACDAPGWPGIEPRWTSSAKSAVGTALTAMSRTWFTLSHGILNEIYYRRPDLACTRDLGLIVTGEHGFFSEEKRHAQHQIKSLARAIPAYDLVNTHAGHYRITKRIVSDPYRDVVLQRLTFEALSQTGGRYRVYALLAPHLVNAGAGNTAWLGEYKGACRCCLPKGEARHWPWPARCLGATPVQASSATRTAGRCFHAMASSTRSGLGRKTATSP